jgi:hypothetical protein
MRMHQRSTPVAAREVTAAAAHRLWYIDCSEALDEVIERLDLSEKGFQKM